MAWEDVDSNEEAARRLVARLEAERSSKAETTAELKEDIMRLVSVRFDELPPQGVRLVELNRRFGTVAARLGTTIRDLVNQLITEKRLGGQHYKDTLVVYDKQAYLVRAEMYRLNIDPEKLNADLKGLARLTVTGE